MLGTPVNPEAIGVFGLVVTTICFGLEQVGVGTKGGDPRQISKSLAFIAIFFGGICQLYTSLHMYLFSQAGTPEASIYLGCVFGFFGLFWVMVGVFFLAGGDKKMFAHFFIIGLFLVILFTIRAGQLGLVLPGTTLQLVLIVIDILLVALPIAWYTGSKLVTKIAGAANIAVGVTAIPILLHGLGII